MTTALLLINDANVRDFLPGYIIAEWGYEVIIAEDVDSCLALAMERHPDVIISDVEIMINLEAQFQEVKQIPFILIRHEPRKEGIMDVIETFPTPLYSYVPMPFHVEELRLTARNLIEKAKRPKDSP